MRSWQSRNPPRDPSAVSASTSPSLSIVIPTWNEASWLPLLLSNLETCSEVAEIIVADNNSRDKTRELATSAGCEVVSGGRPATARNRGAARAAGDIIMFADADTRVTPAVLRAALAEFSDGTTNLVHFRLVPTTGSPFVRSCYASADVFASFCSAIGRPMGSAPVIAVRSETFRAVGGYDEHVRAAEDVDLIRRVGKNSGGVVYVRNPSLVVSSRRFSIEPPLWYAAKCIGWGLLRLFGLRSSGRGYAWLDYPADLAAREQHAEDAA